MVISLIVAWQLASKREHDRCKKLPHNRDFAIANPILLYT